MIAKREPSVGEYVRGIGRVLRIEDVPVKPVPPVRDFIVESQHAFVRLRVAANPSEVLRDYSKYWDFDGEGSAVKEAKNQALALCNRLMIDAQSPFELVVICLFENSRMRPVDGENLYAKDVVKLDPLTFGCRAGLKDREEVVWSSRQPEGVQHGA